jgi:hypothetical protein
MHDVYKLCSLKELRIILLDTVSHVVEEKRAYFRRFGPNLTKFLTSGFLGLY